MMLRLTYGVLCFGLRIIECAGTDYKKLSLS